jgi:hypothetical protein
MNLSEDLERLHGIFTLGAVIEHKKKRLARATHFCDECHEWRPVSEQKCGCLLCGGCAQSPHLEGCDV